MGAEQPSNKKGSIPVYNKVIDKTKLEIVLKKIFFTTQLQRDRKKGVLAQKEKELLAMIAQPKIQRNKESESAKASACVSDVKTVKAQDAVMRYTEIVKDRALVIEMSKGDPAKINDLLPFIESIVWGSKNLNLECVKELEMFIYNSFGPGVYENLLKGTNVQTEIKECFDSILPSEKEVKKYLVEFCRKNSIDLELMNEIGHNISENILADLPDGGNNNGNFGGDNGGFGGNNGGFGGNGGTTIQVDPSKNININVGFYPNQQYQPYQQTQYQQQPYQQQPYQQQQYQPNYQQQQYQPNYQQQQQYQPTYQQQQPYQQPNYQQQQPYQQPTYQQNQNSQPTYQQNQNSQPTYQQPTYQPTNFQQPEQKTQQFQPYSGGMGGITNTTTNNNQTPTTDNKSLPLSFEPSDNSSYPTFKKMNIDPYQPAPKNDLDEFQNRLKRIKDGL